MVQARVVGSLIMRDLTTRPKGGACYGLFSLIARPLFQYSVMMAMFIVVRGKTAFIGNDPYLFWGITLLSYVTCIFPMLRVMNSLSQNHALMALSIVTSFDVILARSILQALISFWLVLIIGLGLAALGVDIVPNDIGSALTAVLSAVYLSFAMGWFSAVIARMWNFWVVIKSLLVSGMYLTSGIIFIPESLPRQVQDIVAWNPMLHVVEGFRAAYYESFNYGLLDRQYLYIFATVCLFLGMLMERLVRGWLLER